MPVEISGKMYKTVAERLKEAHGGVHPRPEGIESIETEVEAVGSIITVKATVVFLDKRQFSGHSLVDFEATGKAERDAPLETCETSAVGRALAMAGYPGSDTGLAGAEELALAGRRDAWRNRPAPAGNGTSTGNKSYGDRPQTGGYVREPARQ